MNKKQIKKSTSGITLIALVITIIVLLILAGVAISAIVKDDGVINKANHSKKITVEKSDKELLALAVQELTIDTLGDEITKEQLETKLAQVFTESENPTVTEKGENFLVKIGNEEFEVSNMGVVKEVGTGNGNEKGTYATAAKDATTGVLSEGNATFKSDGLTAVIPQGFKVINGVDGTQSIAKGLVIQDAKGNEFVWIPVTYTPAGDADPATKKLDSGFLNTFKRSTTSTSYKEPYTSGYTTPTTEADDYYDMMLSVQNNGGFYVGRYEAGIEPTYIDENGEPKTHTARTYKANDTTLPVVVKRDCYPYNFVGWGKSMSNYTNPVTDWDGYNQGYGAVKLSKDLIDINSTGATSTLMYGVQWDAMLKFMGKENDTNSTEWGNHYNNDIVIDRPTARYTDDPFSDTTWTQISTLADKEYPKTNTEGILLTTGAHDDFEEKNIYDVAGNVAEWTMEAFSSSNRVSRGGSSGGNGDNSPAPCRYYDGPISCFSSTGFRPTLYITNE